MRGWSFEAIIDVATSEQDVGAIVRDRSIQGMVYDCEHRMVVHPTILCCWHVEALYQLINSGKILILYRAAVKAKGCSDGIAGDVKAFIESDVRHGYLHMVGPRARKFRQTLLLLEVICDPRCGIEIA